VVIGESSGLGSRAFRLRDREFEFEAGALDRVAAADEESAASFVAERVTLEDMRN